MTNTLEFFMKAAIDFMQVFHVALQIILGFATSVASSGLHKTIWQRLKHNLFASTCLTLTV